MSNAILQTERITISLRKLSVANGAAFLGDVLFKLEDVTFDSSIIQQEYVRRIEIRDLQIEVK